MRAVNIPKGHYHISKGAVKKWGAITKQSIKDIEKCTFNENIKSKKRQKLKIYKNGKVGYKIYKENDQIRYNDIFHTEHIVPISVIKNNLLGLCANNKINKKSVEKELKKIHVCRITKAENEKLNKEMRREKISDKNRSDNWRKNVKNLYNKAGIELAKNK